MIQNSQDKKSRELREQYEDAYFQMLIYEVAKMEGEELLAKNERLKNDPDFQVPESITQKCLETIRREVARQEKKKRMASLRRAAIRVACVAAILGAMAITAYAAVPSFRRAALNLLIQTSEVSTRLVLGDEKQEDPATKPDEQNGAEQPVLFGYVVPQVPEGFILESEKVWEHTSWAQYVDGGRRIIKFSVCTDMSNALDLDTEEGDVEPVKVNGNEGLACEKGSTVRIAWNDAKTGHFLMVTGIDVGMDTVSQLAEAFAGK